MHARLKKHVGVQTTNKQIRWIKSIMTSIQEYMYIYIYTFGQQQVRLSDSPSFSTGTLNLDPKSINAQESCRFVESTDRGDFFSTISEFDMTLLLNALVVVGAGSLALMPDVWLTENSWETRFENLLLRGHHFELCAHNDLQVGSSGWTTAWDRLGAGSRTLRKRCHKCHTHFVGAKNVNDFAVKKCQQIQIIQVWFQVSIVCR